MNKISKKVMALTTVLVMAFALVVGFVPTDVYAADTAIIYNNSGTIGYAASEADVPAGATKIVDEMWNPTFSSITGDASSQTVNISGINVGTFHLLESGWTFVFEGNNTITGLSASDKSMTIQVKSGGSLAISGYLMYKNDNVTLYKTSSDKDLPATAVDHYLEGPINMTPLSHSHNFTYANEGATLTATCTNTDCTLTDNKTSFSIVAPTLTTEGGSGSANATLSGVDDFNTATGLNVSANNIKYVGRDGTTYEESATAPTSAGKYTAKITAGDVTASVDYEIAKAADPVTPDTPTTPTDNTSTTTPTTTSTTTTTTPTSTPAATTKVTAPKTSDNVPFVVIGLIIFSAGIGVVMVYRKHNNL